MHGINKKHEITTEKSRVSNVVCSCVPGNLLNYIYRTQ